MIRAALVPFLLLAACTAVQTPPAPQAARLSAQVLTLTLTDGTVCRGNWVAAPQGRLDDCGPGFGYAVRVLENPNILRRILSDVTRALGAEGALAPMAEVVITDPAGIDTVFVSPPPVPQGD